MSDEKYQDMIAPAQSSTESVDTGKVDLEDDGEIFKRGEGIEDFRTVSWIHTSVIFLKRKLPSQYTIKESIVLTMRYIVIFATGVLTIPSAMYTLGALPGAINVLGWQALNTWGALVQGQFRNNHPGCHSIADMGQLVGGRVVKEIAGVLFLIAFIIVGASGMVGVSTALNALSNHSLCTNYFSIIAAIMVGVCASVRKFEKIAWITWAGFASVFIAVFIVV